MSSYSIHPVLKISPAKVVFLLACVQAINILDFMMVMPLGPDFSKELGIPNSRLGIIGGSYTAAAALSGIWGSFFLDRYDRRTVLFVAMLGLVIGTALGGLSTGMGMLLVTRVLAGFFGGPATSICYSIVADVIAPEERGRAIGAMMGSFAFASVVGVPFALELSRQGSWRLPFFVLGGLGVLVTVGVLSIMPKLRLHLDTLPSNSPLAFRALFTRPLILLSYVMTALVMSASFVVIPNISAYVQYNLGYPRKDLGLLYLVGGVVSFFAMRFVGKLVDRMGSFVAGTMGAAMLLGTLYLGFISYVPTLPVLPVFVSFMLAMSFRNVAYNTLTSKVPRMEERARFMSMQSAVQHLAAAVGAMFSAQLLRERADHSLEGIDKVAWVSFGLTLILPLVLYRVEQGVKKRDAMQVKK